MGTHGPVAWPSAGGLADVPAAQPNLGQPGCPAGWWCDLGEAAVSPGPGVVLSDLWGSLWEKGSQAPCPCGLPGVYPHHFLHPEWWGGGTGAAAPPTGRDVIPPRFNVSAGPCSEVGSDARWLLIIRIMGRSLGGECRVAPPSQTGLQGRPGPQCPRSARHVLSLDK